MKPLSLLTTTAKICLLYLLRVPTTPLTATQLAKCDTCRWASEKKRWCCNLRFYLRPKKPHWRKTHKTKVDPGEKQARIAVGCCGKKSPSALAQVSQIARGYYHYKRGLTNEQIETRIAICIACDEHTWLSRREYKVWLWRHGIEVLREFTDLTALPRLDIRRAKDSGNAELYCALCKCCIPAKARVPELECPIGLWKKAGNHTLISV